MRRGGLPDAVRYSKRALTIIDQTALPLRLRYLKLRSAADTAAAVKRLAIRGAPWIGVAAAYGLAVEARRLADRQLTPGLARAAEMLASARPTAVNLRWAVGRVMGAVGVSRQSPAAIRRCIEREARRIEREETARSYAMARHGAKLVPKCGVVLTICNTGALAAPGIGTALGVVFQAYLEGKRPFVFACETRPLLQGARLTMFELKRAGIESAVIADSAAASVVAKCDLVLAGADRIAANGDTANKVGTRMLGILAQDAGKPLYVVAPSTTFDLSLPDGAGIEIEERGAEEVAEFQGCRAAPRGVRVFNPAFDVTPGRLVAGFVTERGIIRPPFQKSIRRVLSR
jgi:methylthioribose-1-phosphate isomerase